MIIENVPRVAGHALVHSSRGTSGTGSSYSASAAADALAGVCLNADRPRNSAIEHFIFWSVTADPFSAAKFALIVLLRV